MLSECRSTTTPSSVTFPGFRSPFDIPWHSISPVLRSTHRPLSPSNNTPFVQRLLSARPQPVAVVASPPPSSVSTDFDSPLTSPLTSDNEEQTPIKRKLPIDEADVSPRPHKQSRTENIIRDPSQYPDQTYPLRSFPPQTSFHSAFPLFYRRFPVSSYQTSMYAVSFLIYRRFLIAGFSQVFQNQQRVL